MDFVFAADARQSRPLRPGMGPLVAAGGLFVPGEEVGKLEQDIEGLCREYGFAECEEFLSSPDEDASMYGNHIGHKGWRFLKESVRLLRERRVVAVVMVHDADCPTFSGATEAEMDVAGSFLRWVETRLAVRKSDGAILAPANIEGGGPEEGFVGGHLETLVNATSCSKASGVTLSALSLSLRHERLLQLAGVIVSCTTAVVGGDRQYAGELFAPVRGLLARKQGRTGRVGLSLHPYYMYANLYHWLVGDSHFWMHGTGFALPLACYPYSSRADVFGPCGQREAAHREEKAQEKT